MKEKKSLLSRFNKYKKEQVFKEQINPIKRYELPKIEWIIKEKTIKAYDLIPNVLGWSMKVIGKTGSGKTTFVSAFIDFC